MTVCVWLKNPALVSIPEKREIPFEGVMTDSFPERGGGVSIPEKRDLPFEATADKKGKGKK